jgi:uncharacterized protein YifE (UPF0438 family)
MSDFQRAEETERHLGRQTARERECVCVREKSWKRQCLHADQRPKVYTAPTEKSSGRTRADDVNPMFVRGFLANFIYLLFIVAGG